MAYISDGPLDAFDALSLERSKRLKPDLRLTDVFDPFDSAAGLTRSLQDRIYPDWQSRVIEEHRALRDNRLRLRHFIGMSEFGNLAGEVQELMLDQESAMRLYERILEKRIALF